VFVAILGMAFLLVMRRRRQTPRERVEQFVSAPRPDLDSEPTLTRRLASSTERSLSGSAWWQRFSEAVDVADLPWDAARLLMNSLAIAAALGLLFAAATGQIAMVLLCIVAVPVVLALVVRSRVARRRRLFGDQLADHLAVVGSTLRAGHSFPAALAADIDDAPEPTRTEFGRAVADERLGAPLDEALENVARRMDSRDVDQVALLARLQREAGADAAEMLDGVVVTIRERQELRRTVRTLTAQGRLTRVILSGLPVVILLGLLATNPDYLDPLFNTNSGRTLAAAAVAMVVMGSLAIKRIVDFDI
jgi:tight adherence protein B